MPVPERLVALEGAFNFRDLGGYPSRDGQHTRWGRLYRSDTLHELTEADVKVIRELGLTTVIDLRTPKELARTGRGLLGPEPIGFHHLSVLGDGTAAGTGTGTGTPGEAMAAPAPVGEDLSARYRWYLDVGRVSLTEALTLIGDPARLPLVFHYVITASRMEPILDRFRRSDPEAAERLAQVPPATYGVEAVTMQSFLDDLDGEFGGARAWAETAGVPTATLDRIPELLLEP
jgi:protein-tyrosine phosphatase